MKLKSYEEAYNHLQDAQAARTVVEPDADRTLETMRDFAFVAAELGRFSTAIRVYNNLLIAERNKFGVQDPRTSASQADYMKVITKFANSLQLSEPKTQGTPSLSS